MVPDELFSTLENFRQISPEKSFTKILADDTFINLLLCEPSNVDKFLNFDTEGLFEFF